MLVVGHWHVLSFSTRSQCLGTLSSTYIKQFGYFENDRLKLVTTRMLIADPLRNRYRVGQKTGLFSFLSCGKKTVKGGGGFIQILW